MKRCRCCAVEKPLDEFYLLEDSPDGHFQSCKECTKRRARERFQNKKKEIYEQRKAYRRTPTAREAGRRYSQMYRKKNPEKVREKQKRSIQKHPERRRARENVRRKLDKARTRRCVLCGQPAQEWHHHRGYSKEFELDVIPVCGRCHNIADILQRIQNGEMQIPG